MRFILLLALLFGLVACEDEKKDLLVEDDVVRLIPTPVKGRREWARAVLDAITAIEKEPTAERVCAVLAVIEQESGYQENPRVEGLAHIVRQDLEKKLAKLGPLAKPALETLLSMKAPGSDKTFGERIALLRTERDLDRMFRELEAAYRGKMPQAFAFAGILSKVFGKGPIEKLNPVTTLGSMQVKLSYAMERPENQGLHETAVREMLYTRAGGVRYGTARLLDFPASYDDVVYRFADFNAGFYASRNAAFQQMLSDLTGRRLRLDGDILAYDDDGDAKDQETETLSALRAFGAQAGIWGWVLKYDAAKEKDEAFERSFTWWRLRSKWEDRFGKEAPYARIPDLLLDSPKLQRGRSTAWFAMRVKDRYRSCRSRHNP